MSVVYMSTVNMEKGIEVLPQAVNTEYIRRLGDKWRRDGSDHNISLYISVSALQVEVDVSFIILECNLIKAF